jgi:hypothetical protein
MKLDIENKVQTILSHEDNNKFRDITLNITDLGELSLLAYLIQNHELLTDFKNKYDVNKLIVIDFLCNRNEKIFSKKINIDEIIEQGIEIKTSPNTKKKKEYFSIEQTPCSLVASAFYLSLFKNKEIKSLITLAKDKNDLRAILLIDMLYKSLYKPVADKTIASNQNPEQIALELLKQKHFERGLENIHDYVTSLRNLEKKVLLLTKKLERRKQAKELLSIKAEIAKYSKQFSTYRNKRDYKDFVSNIFKSIERINSIIDSYIKEKTAKLLSSINPKYKLTGNLDEDEKRCNEEDLKLAEAKKIYNWLKIESDELRGIEKQLNERKKYLRGVRDTSKSIESHIKEIDKNLISNTYSYFENITKEKVQQLLHNKQRLRDLLKSFELYREDIYLKNNVEKLSELVNKVQRDIDYKIHQIKCRIRSSLQSLNPEFESTGSIEQDFNKIQELKLSYNNAVSVYNVIGTYNQEIILKGNLIQQTEKRYQEIKEKSDIINNDKKRIEQVSEEVSALINLTLTVT